MKGTVRRALSALLSVVMLLSLLVVPVGAAGETGGETGGTGETAAHTIWVVGDSTACDYGPEDDKTHYYKRCGYGTALGEYYMAEGYQVQNLAISGISSKSFLSHANYATLFGADGIKSGDILIIGFGHNDEKAEDPARYTSPTGDWQTEGSFAKNLYDNYVAKAQEKGAKVILCTSIVRRAKDGVNFSDANLHIANGGSYPEAVIKLGQDKSIPVVDLTAITKDKYIALGADENVKLHAWSTDQPSSVDGTHLNKYGAKWVAYWLVQAITESTDPLFTDDLKAAFSLTAGEPTAADLVAAATPGWTLPPYTPPADDAASAQYTDPFIFENKKTGAQDQFKPTGFGDISLTGPTLEVTEDGQVHIKGNAKGKIAGNHDGVYMYYYRIPKDTLFTFTATARVNELGTGDGQTAFGLMARDDMYIDKKNDTTIASNYVVAGCLTQNANTTNCFYRNGGNVGNKNTLTAPAVKTGDTVKLSIVSNSDGYTCTIDGQTPQSANFDILLTNVDTENIYVGMFANRNADIYFRDIYLKVGDDVICDTRSDVVPFSFQVMDDGWKFEDAKGAASTQAVQGGKLTSITGVLNGDGAEALVFAAVYDLNGKMTGVKAITPKSGEIPVGLKMNGGETAKVFVLKKGTLDPYGPAFEKTSGMPPKDPDAPEGRIKVWDFAGVEETDEKTYENMVTATAWKAAGVTAGSIASGNHEVNGVIYNESSTGTLCSNVEGWPGTKGGYGVKEFADGYSSNGGIYAGGAGNNTASRRYLIVKGVKAGDKITVYAGTSKNDIAFSAGPISTGTTATTEYTSHLITGASGSYDKFAFVAKQDGDYKIWHDVDVGTSSGGKPVYCRVMVARPAEVKGTITGVPAAVTGYGVKFINQTTKEETVATLSGNNFTAKLAPGYTYSASLTGAAGYGFTNATKLVTVTDAESVTGKTGVALTVEEKHQYTYSGKITGFAQGYDLTNLAVTLVPDADAPAGTEEVTLTLGDDLSYSVKLDPSVNYIVNLAGVNDYEITAGGTVISEGDPVAQGITVALKDQFAATGKFVTLSDGNVYGPLYADYEYADLGATVTALTFTNVDDDYAYTATVENGGYSVNLRDGAYLAAATVDGWKTSTHVVVDGGAVTRDLFFVSTAEPAAVTYVADIYVGDETKGELNYATITQAVDAIGRMTRTADQRVTVHIAPGVYREQVQLDTPNVTFVGTDPTKETKLTWYYGIGYKYYSASGGGSTKSIYDVEKAYDKYGKDIAGRWGATMWLTADGFRAENITLECSFNNYLTEEELADGVTCDTCKFERKYGAEVTSKAATERASVIYVDGSKASKTEFKNCKFLSSQDTLMTGGNMYFKNCLIEGMTDYICGPGNAIFDGCELRFKGYHKDYANAATGGHLTAPQTGTGENDKGYLFRGCSITASPNANMTVATGDFGRNWSAKAGAMFVNTKLQRADLISAAGWTDWSASQLAKDANFKEYNTTLFNGDAVSTTGRVEGTVLTAAPTVALTDYFGAWTPYYYVAEPETVAFTTEPTLSDNGDINAPYPGHTLTVNYSLGDNDVNDASLIQWYRVKDSAETLVKSSVANVDKTYLIDKADEGCMIKVTVTPRTAGGKTGTAASFTMVEAVKEGFEDPTGSTDPVLGEGVNLFLAGDSTVKDYSAKGMYMNGKPQNAGSWGEFLQAYVDDSVVTVVNYANGGRSARTFYNEGSLLKIEKNIKAGDYLFIQFGHNDSGGSEKYPDRCVPLGEPDSNGIYPVTAPTTGNAPTMAADGTITEGTYTWDCGGTYKWYLQQYIDVAVDAGAIPVLMTPVARMYYGSDGKIASHHNWGGVKGAGSTYCDAVEQLYQENLAAGKNVLFLDTYALTEDMFNDAYTAGGSDAYGKQVMDTGESTHSNKLGGMIEAALVAQSLQTVKDKDDKNISIAHAVKAPAAVLGETTTGGTVFMVNAAGTLTANDILTGYTTPATYWQTFGQSLFQAIATKAAELNTPVTPAP